MVLGALRAAWPLLLAATPPQQGVAALDSVFESLRREEVTPAAGIAVVHRGRIIYKNVAGFANIEHRVPATEATRFDWASVGKQVTAYAVALLEGQGRLSVRDEVRTYIPEFALGGARVTIGDLLHHTSGLYDVDGLAVLAGSRPGDPLSTSDLVPLVARQEFLRFAPGSAHAYANSGYVLLAEVVARVTGTSFVGWTDRMVFQRLGMRESAFVDGTTALVPHMAHAYVRDGVGGAFVASTTDRYAGAGGLLASIGDMATWVRHLLSPQGDRAATLRLRTRGTLRSGDTLTYAWGLGHGVYRGQATLSHGGSGPASAAFLLLFPEFEFGVVVAVGGESPVDPARLAYQASDLMLASALAPRDTTPTRGRRAMMITTEMYSTPPAESRGVRVSAETLARHAGTYVLPDGSTAVIRARGERLEMLRDGRPPAFPLHPLPGERFVMVPLWDVYSFRGEGDERQLVRERVARSLRRDGDSVVVAKRRPDVRFTELTAAPYVGAYYSSELRALYEVVLRDGRLVLEHPRHGSMPLIPLDDARFGVEGLGIVGARFARGGTRMEGLELEARAWGTSASFRHLPIDP